MKTLQPVIFSLLLLYCSIPSAAQKNLPVKEPDTNRPVLLKNLPSRISCHVNDLESLLLYPVGKKVNIQIADEIQFLGTVSSISSQDDHSIKSVVIRSGNIEGAALTFSKIIKEDGSAYFTGRLISFRHADVYEIKNEKGQYVFLKKSFYDVINE